jgi:hypothetical protein
MDKRRNLPLFYVIRAFFLETWKRRVNREKDFDLILNENYQNMGDQYLVLSKPPMVRGFFYRSSLWPLSTISLKPAMTVSTD